MPRALWWSYGGGGAFLMSEVSLYPGADMLNVWYEFVNFGAGNSPAKQIGESGKTIRGKRCFFHSLATNSFV